MKTSFVPVLYFITITSYRLREVYLKFFVVQPFSSQCSLLIPLKTSENQTSENLSDFLMFSGDQKGAIGKKRVKINNYHKIIFLRDNPYFFISVLLSRVMAIHRTTGKGRKSSVFLSTISTRLWIFRHLFSTMHVRLWGDHLVLLIALHVINRLLFDEICPPLGISIWLNVNCSLLDVQC